MSSRPSQATSAKYAPPLTPPGTRLYAIGDIHGRVDLLGRMHQLIQDDMAANPRDRQVIVYLGDYIDRGPDSAEVIELLLRSPVPGCQAVHLLGNHEDSLLRFLDDVEVGSAWLYYGGIATLVAYDIDVGEYPWRNEIEMMRLQAELRRRLPARHRRFLQGLPLSHTEGDFMFVHAGVRPGVPLDRQVREDVLWIRDEFLASPADHGKIVVHGHTISPDPENLSNRIGIDTGAYATGRLTCLVLDGASRSFMGT
ncbi:MAG: metallophosphoesterase family protein [Dongiaceae bacterium]